MAKRRKVDNLTGLAILSAVVFRPMHPYEMASALRGWGKDNDVPIKWGSLYTVVRNLAKHGLLEEVGSTREGQRPERTTYRITEAGRAELVTGHASNDLASDRVDRPPSTPISRRWSMRRHATPTKCRQSGHCLAHSRADRPPSQRLGTRSALSDSARDQPSARSPVGPGRRGRPGGDRQSPVATKRQTVVDASGPRAARAAAGAVLACAAAVLLGTALT